MKAWAIGLLVVATAGCAAMQRVQVVQQNMPAVVHLSVAATEEYGPTTYTGTGVAISRSGHILTCAHLFEQGQKEVEVTFLESGTAIVGSVLSVDSERDLALVKISSPTLSFVQLAHDEDTLIGEDVVVIGHPMGLKWTVTAGIVSGFRERGLLMQVDADINPGNSGGPVFNLDGELIGIAVKMRSPIPASVGLNFAVSIEEIHVFLEQFKGL